MGRGMITVDVEGNFYPCHRFVGSKGFQLGSLFEGFDDSKTERILQESSPFITRFCRICPYTGLCNGVCPNNIANDEGGFETETLPESCVFSIAMFKEILYLILNYAETPDKLINYCRLTSKPLRKPVSSN